MPEIIQNNSVAATPLIPTTPLPVENQPPQPTQPVVVSTSKLADQNNTSAKTAMTTAQTQMQNQAQTNAATTAANQPVVGSGQQNDPIVQEAMSPKPIDQISPVAQFYRSYGRMPVGGELDSFLKQGTTTGLTTAINNLSNGTTQPPQTGTGGPWFNPDGSLGGYWGKDANGNDVKLPLGQSSSTDQSGSGTGSDQYATDMNSLQAKRDDATQKVLDSFDQFRNGTLPLTPAQQAQIDALKNQFLQLHQEQQFANRNYEGGITNITVSSGRSRYAPELAQGEIYAAVSAGLQKVQKLDSEAASAVAQMEMGFQTQNLDIIKSSYGIYNDALKEKQATIQKMHDDATAAVKDARDFQAKQTQQDFENTLASSQFSFAQKKEAFDEYIQNASLSQKQKETAFNQWATTQDLELKKQKQAFDQQAVQLDNTPIGSAIENALAGLKFSTVADRKDAQKQIQGLLAQGDTQGAQELLKSYVRNSASNAQIDILDGKENAIAALKRIQDSLVQYEKMGGNTGIFTGASEQALEKFGKQRDSDLAKLRSDIALGIIDYRHAVSGAAFTESEASQYESIFPSIGNTKELNQSKIDALLNKFQADTENFYRQRVGETKYDTIFGGQVYMEVANKIGQALSSGLQPGDIINELLQPASPVRDNVLEYQKAGASPSEILQHLQQKGIGSFSDEGSVSTNAQPEQLADAIGQQESSGNYQAVSPVNRNGERAYGKYQVLASNIPAWTKEVLGKALSVTQFLADKKAQDAVAVTKIGQLLQKHGSWQNVASVWFSGRPLAGNVSTDITGKSVPSYVKDIGKRLNTA